MKLLTLDAKGTPHVGALAPEGVVDLTEALALTPSRHQRAGLTARDHPRRHRHRPGRDPVGRDVAQGGAP
jgi:hypothetical protein